MMILLIAFLSLTKTNDFLSAREIMDKAYPVKKTGEKYPFECDYRIDLRMDYILVKKNDEIIDTVQYGELETYFV